MSVIVQTGLPEAAAQDINNPRICYHKRTATASASNSASGYDPTWLTDGETWSAWQAGSTSVLVTLDFGSSVSVSYAGLAAHNLGTIGASVQLLSSTDGSSFSTISGISSTSVINDSALLWLFAQISVRALRFVISGGSAAEIAVAQAGLALEMPRASVYTALPISESKQVRYRHQQSIRGDVLGRAVEGSDLQFDVSIQHLPEAFRAAIDTVSWDGFKAHVEDTGPFFIATKPGKYPDDVAYARCIEQPRFNRTLPNAEASGEVVLSCMGYAAP